MEQSPTSTRPAKRFLLIGAGGWGRTWGRTLQAAEGVELAGVVDPSSTALERMCEEFAMPQAACFRSLAGALIATSCDAVIVATPMWSHHDAVSRCLEAGKHVLCEKPLATSMAEAASLDHAATRTGHILMVGQSYRYRRPARAVRRVLSDSILGTLLSVRIITRRDTSTFWDPTDRRYTIPHFYLLDNGVHHLDTLRAVTGRDVVRVCSRGWPAPDSPYTHDAGGVTLLDLEGGASVLYDNEYAASGRQTSWNGEWDITGTKGRLLWRGGDPDADSAEITLELTGHAPTPVQLPERTGSELQAELAEFISAIETGEPPETSSADNLKTMAAVFGCVQSVETGRVVSIPDLLQEAACGT